jgi:GGDEF domain-containing protein
MTDRRLLVFALGLVGLGCGIASLATGNGVLGLIAGALAVAPAAVVVGDWRRANDAVALPVQSTEHMPAPVVSPAHPSNKNDGLTDTASGLLNEDYFRVAVESRVLAARRHLRPVAVVLFDVIDGIGPGASTKSDPSTVGQAIRQTLREADTACRLNDGRYGFVLEDTPEDGAIWTVERLRRKLSEFDGNQTRWAGVACYPAHAFSASEVLAKAENALIAAREWAQDRIEVAATE